MVVTFIIMDGSLRNAPYARPVKSLVGFLPVAMLLIFLAVGGLDHLALMKEFHNREQRFLQELASHVYLAFTAVGIAVLIGVPLGLAAWRRKTFEKPVFLVVNGIQTIPSLALFGLMIAPLAFLSREFPVLRDMGIQGIGNAPALVALSLYSLLPITRNTFTSLAVIPDSLIDAGTGVGMNRRQLLRLVEVPMSVPIVLSGIRVSAVQAIGNTAVAALIGAGGLGNFVFQGLGQAAPDLIVMGVLPIIAMAVTVDRIFGALIHQLTPRALRANVDD
jgi:osmoprotectant transport system permease protein